MPPAPQRHMSKAEFFYRVSYYPSEAQLKVHRCNARFRIVCAGARFGKSMAGGAEIAYYFTHPDFRTWCVACQYEQAEKEYNWAIEFLSRYKLKSGKKLIDKCHKTNASKGSRILTAPWGSFIQTKSATKPDTLLGEELDLECFGEGAYINKSVWERMLRPRLGSRKGGIINFSTGAGDMGLFADMNGWGASEETKNREWTAFSFDTKENPTFPRDEYEQARIELDEKVFAEQYQGKLVGRRGVVFDTFSTKIHVYETSPADMEHWPVIRAVHHEKNSYNNPFACVFVAISPETREYWVYDEVYINQANIEDACAKITEKSKGRRIVTTITDYRNPTLKDAVKKYLGSAVVNNEKKYNSKHATVRKIQALQNALKLKEGKSEIHISEACKNTIMEFQNLKWPEPKKEEREQAEAELPTTKYISLPIAVSQVVAFCKISLCGAESVYEAQGLKR